MNDIFEALADPTRRAILDRLRVDGPLSVSQVAEPLDMTRQGATKHLDVLARTGLLRVRWAGRQRLHELKPEPLTEIQAWLAPYEAEWDRRLARLERHLSDGHATRPAHALPSDPENP